MKFATILTLLSVVAVSAATTVDDPSSLEAIFNDEEDNFTADVIEDSQRNLRFVYGSMTFSDFSCEPPEEVVPCAVPPSRLYRNSGTALTAAVDDDDKPKKGKKPKNFWGKNFWGTGSIACFTKVKDGKKIQRNICAPPVVPNHNSGKEIKLECGCCEGSCEDVIKTECPTACTLPGTDPAEEGVVLVQVATGKEICVTQERANSLQLRKGDKKWECA